jgi:hypothetical protein
MYVCSCIKDVQRELSKRVNYGHRLPTLRAATTATAVRLFQEWPFAGCGKAGLGEP